VCRYEIDGRENKRGTQERMIQRNWQHLMNKTHDEEKQNTAQYVLNTTMRKHIHIKLYA